MYGLLLYIPVSGVPIIAAYPHTGWPNLIKDFVFVIPAYFGYAASGGLRRGSIRGRTGWWRWPWTGAYIRRC